MAGLYTIQGTFIIAVAFNIKGLFKRRFTSSFYMTLSILFYEILLFYILFIDSISRQVPSLANINGTINGFFKVAICMTR